MPRTPIVSRELKVSRAECYLIDMSGHEPVMYQGTLYAGRVYKTEAPLLEALRAFYETHDFKIAKVRSFKTVKIFAKQSTEKFVAKADEIKEIPEEEKE